MTRLLVLAKSRDLFSAVSTNGDKLKEIVSLAVVFVVYEDLPRRSSATIGIPFPQSKARAGALPGRESLFTNGGR